MTEAWEFRWANDRGANGLPHPDELAREGYLRIAQHPRWPSSWLMVREAPAA